MCILDFEENLGFLYRYQGNGSGSRNIMKLHNSTYWYMSGNGTGAVNYLEHDTFVIIDWNYQCLI
jgi:hypothetical protein